jgi:undecaprenyl-diphosphatase
MPTMTGAFVFELADVARQLTLDRAIEIAIGFVAAFLAALLVVRPFLRFVARSGFAPFAWYRIVAGVGIVAAMRAGWL